MALVVWNKYIIKIYIDCKIRYRLLLETLYLRGGTLDNPKTGWLGIFIGASFGGLGLLSNGGEGGKFTIGALLLRPSWTLLRFSTIGSSLTRGKLKTYININLDVFDW